MSPDDAIVIAYGLSNGLRLLSYAPQIWRVSRDRAGAQAISCLSWNLWAAANLTTALYAWTQLQDAVLTLVNGANALCCLAVVLITCIKRAGLGRPTPVRRTPHAARRGLGHANAARRRA